MSRQKAFLLKVLKHKVRQEIIDFLKGKREIKSTDIHIKPSKDQSVILQPLTILTRIGIVITQRKSELDYFSLDIRRLDEISRIVDKKWIKRYLNQYSVIV